MLLSAPGVALAQDTEPPQISHVRIERAPMHEPLTIRARIEDDSEIFAPSVYVRVKGSTEYQSFELKKSKDAYVARIPRALVVGDLEYFIEAFDEHGNGPARDGEPEIPIEVEVFDPAEIQPAIVAPPPLTSSTEAGKGDDGGVTSEWWFWALVAGAVAGGVTAAVLLSQGGQVDFVDVSIRGPDPVGAL